MRHRVVIVSPSIDLSSSLEQVLRDSGCSPETLNQHPAINDLPGLESAQEPPAALLIDSVSESETLSLFWRLRDSLLRFRSSGTPLNNVCIFVNRDASWGDADRSTLEQIIGLPVEWIIDNDYAPVRQAALKGQSVTDSPSDEGLSAALDASGPSDKPGDDSERDKRAGGEDGSITELVSALLNVTAKPLRSVEQDWSAQLLTLQSGIDERFGVVEQVALKVTRAEEAIEAVHEFLLSAESRTRRTENKTNNCLAQYESLQMASSGLLQDVGASIEELRKDMVAREEKIREFRHLEERQAEVVERLAKVFSEVRDTVGQPATGSSSAHIDSSENKS